MSGLSRRQAEGPHVLGRPGPSSAPGPHLSCVLSMLLGRLPEGKRTATSPCTAASTAARHVHCRRPAARVEGGRKRAKEAREV